MSLSDDIERELGNLILNDYYRVLSLLGEGGFGKVYVAEHILFPPEPPNPPKLYAVKQLSIKGLERSKRIKNTPVLKFVEAEARKLANLLHDAIPRTYVPWFDGENFFLVMDFVPGATLRAYLEKSEQGFLPYGKVIEWGRQLASVLTYLHDQDPILIHRDITPENVMVTPQGRLVLIDFGIARFYKLDQTSDTEMFGKLGYVPMEVYRRRQTDERSDIWSLGAVLYEMLTGDCPSMHPFEFGPLETKQRVPRSLQSLINQMILEDREQRPPYMRYVLNRLIEEQRKFLNID